ncbi:hypothetical protein [Paenibacillus sp.]|jgi:hypothetical protein|uniref:hypothetical protein n=1 Tax=Paenibacillus sp. TaxID=58172 RepID=UPI00282E0AFB|nr:hypothetical protein [Paenibacillus sp.]MDR0267343.1 hypothetical protein [Paenibacillus sp.]
MIERSKQYGFVPVLEFDALNRYVYAKIQFEHRSELVDDEELERCYHWVSELLAEDSY